MSFGVVVLAFHSQQIFTDAQIPLTFLYGQFMKRGPLPCLLRYSIKNRDVNSLPNFRLGETIARRNSAKNTKAKLGDFRLFSLRFALLPRDGKIFA